MSSNAFILADRDRLEQFAVIARGNRLFRGFEVWHDADGTAWARRRVGRHCIAVCLLGPSWVFDPHAQARWAEDLADRRRHFEQRLPAEHRKDLERIIAGLRLGPIAERLLWAIHQRVVEAKRSVVRMPDDRLARLVWGSSGRGRPRHWRRVLRQILKGLTWLHVAAWPEDGQPQLGQTSALLTHIADLKRSSQNVCDEDCPDRGGPPHRHFLVNIGRGFLGVMEQFAQVDDEAGVRTYAWKRRGRKEDGPTLRSVGKTGRLVTVYVPAKLGDPAACRRFSARQYHLLQALVRETTRNTRHTRRTFAEADVFSGNRIPGIQHKTTLTCSLLEVGGRYVGFNGSGKRKGLGYGLSTPGGWLVKRGYRRVQYECFFRDLAALVEPLGLIPVGIHVPTRRCMAVEEMLRDSRTVDGRRILAETHLRIYTSADYVERWNGYFKWEEASRAAEGKCPEPGSDLRTIMRRKRITQATLARGIAMDPSLLSKLLRDKKRWPAGLLNKAQRWLDSQPEPKPERHGSSPREPSADTPQSPPATLPSMLPLLAAVECGEAAMLDVALGYLGRGWSVVPQQSGAKQPCVRWKPFQQRSPTPEELDAWFTQWPQAGLAVVLGPVSNLLVVDVDGAEAHGVLMERLGSEPRAPKAISGSGKPHRYHLFFRCPTIATRAKATPWHPKLEFRGKGGIVVIPPSLHASGNRYRWAEEQSLDELPPPRLPNEILAALQPPEALPATEPPGDGNIDDASPSTRRFLAGDYADGPGWNARLFQAACDLAGRGMALKKASRILIEGARPWDAQNREIARRTIESAFAQPRKPSQR